jgi:hypothetical protein
MPKIAIWFALIAVSLGIGRAAFAQGYALITIERPFQAQNLGGVVIDPTGTPVEGVTVKECDASFTSVLASTWTDKEGHFVFPKAKRGSTHYLSLSKDGFNPMHIAVHLRHLAHAGVRIHLHMAA